MLGVLSKFARRPEHSAKLSMMFKAVLRDFSSSPNMRVQSSAYSLIKYSELFITKPWMSGWAFRAALNRSTHNINRYGEMGHLA